VGEGVGILVVVGLAVCATPSVGLGDGAREGWSVLGADEGCCDVGASVPRMVGRAVGVSVEKGARVWRTVGARVGESVGFAEVGRRVGALVCGDAVGKGVATAPVGSVG